MAEALSTSGSMTQAEAASVREHQKRGRFVEAITILTRCIDRARSPAAPSDDGLSSEAMQQPPPLSLLMQRARCYCRLHEWSACARDCDEILTRSPTDVTANSLRVECILGLKRYDEAEQRINALVAQTHSASAAPYAPLQRLWKQIQEERQGRFDVATMSAEAFSLVNPGPARADFSLDGLRRQRCIPCVRLGPHADYLHPSVECGVPMAGKGRGTRVRSASLSNSSIGGSAGSSGVSSINSSQNNAGVSAASATSSSSALGHLPRHTLVMSMKALSVYLRCDSLSDRDMLMRKLVDQPHLADQVERLYGGPAGEQRRAKLLQQRSAEDVWLESSSSSSAHDTDSVRAHESLLTSALSHNPFVDGLDNDGLWPQVGGGALFFLPSLLNHSCVPNCSWRMIGDQMFVRTNRDVAPGEELTLLYQSAADIGDLRSKLLQEWYFSCQCDLCSAWLALHPAIVQREACLADAFGSQEELVEELQIFAFMKWSLGDSGSAPIIQAAYNMQDAIETHQRYLSAHSQPLSSLHVTLLQPLEGLSVLLHELLRMLSSSHAEFPSLLSLHLRTSLSRLTIAERWKPHDCLDATVEALRLQVKYSAHATLTVQEQQARMQQCIADYISARGDTDSKALRRHQAAPMRQAGLEQLFECCLEEREEEA